MEAKDTGMTPSQIKEAWLKACKKNTALDMLNYPLVITQAQAEISFEAGIREVVEWGEGDCDCEHKLLALRKQCPYCQKAKLKEWGITT